MLGNSSDAFLLLRAKSLGMADAHIPLLFAALHISKMLSSVPGGALSDRLDRKTVVVAGWLIYAAVYFGFAHAASALQVWTLFICYGFFFGLTEGTERAWVADLVTREIADAPMAVFISPSASGRCQRACLWAGSGRSSALSPLSIPGPQSRSRQRSA